jgi:aerobic C4-dicarboxylate transport protein
VIATGLPAEGLALLLGVDRFMSQGRSVVNMIGNAVAAVVVAKWEGAFDSALWQATRTGTVQPPLAAEAAASTSESAGTSN